MRSDHMGTARGGEGRCTRTALSPVPQRLPQGPHGATRRAVWSDGAGVSREGCSVYYAGGRVRLRVT